MDYPGDWKTKLTISGYKWDVTPKWSVKGLNPVMDANEVHANGYTKNGVPTLNDDKSYQGSATGAQTFDTSYTATDNGDGATGTAYYHLTLHDPVEPLSEGQITSVYSVFAPMKLNGQVMAWDGGPTGRSADEPETTIKVVTSIESGYDLTATATISPFKDLLGFTGSANFTSTKSVSVDTEAKVPAIGANQMRYLIAKHSFQRTHSRFLMFDQSGEIRRMVKMNSFGTVFNPPIAMYHEAFRDNKFMAEKDWSNDIANTTPMESLPEDTIPPLEYDFFPSANSS